MDQSAPTTLDDPMPETARGLPLGIRRASWTMRLTWGLGVVALFSISTALAYYIRQHTAGDVVLALYVVLLICVIGVLLLLGALLREVMYWRRPVNELGRLINEIRAGEMPMSALNAGSPALTVVIEPIRAVLFDLREQKRINRELQEEMRQRILNRTDALERQLGSLKVQASRDAMTGLGNRRSFDQMVPAIYDACSESAEDLCVLMVDVDNFKILNDSLGHAAGDEVLRGIGEIIRNSIRGNDAAFRIGGDEFAVLLPRADLAVGIKLAERVSKLLDQLVMPLRTRVSAPPRLSIGIAARSESRCRTCAELLAKADERLYAEKKSRPNRPRRSVA